MSAVDLFVKEDGASDNPALVFLGSLGSDHRMWDPQAAAFGSTFRVLRPDLRGHGQSPVPPGPYEIGDLAADIFAMLDRAGVERAHIVGLSLGAMVAMHAASTRPERVETLTLICTSAHLGPRDPWLERAALVRGAGTAAVSSAVVERWFTPAFASAHPDLIAQMRLMVEHTPAEGYAACCEAIAGMDLRGQLGNITMPTLVVAGSEDPSTPPPHLQAIARGVNSSTYLEVSPGAHLSSWEQQDRVNTAIQQHLYKEPS